MSPAVKESGALISHITTEVEVSCLPKDLPGFIEVDLSEMTTARALHVSALQLPPGVKVVTRGKLDPVVAAAVVPRAQVETEEEAAAAAPAADAAAAAAGGGACRSRGREEGSRQGRKEEGGRQGRQEEIGRAAASGTKARRVRPGGPFCCSRAH